MFHSQETRAGNWQNSHRQSLHVRRSINSRNVNGLLYMHCFENNCFRNDCVDKKM